MEAAPATVDIESLDYEGRGVARREGKTVFVEGALPGETVVIETVRRKPTFELARAVRRVAEASPTRPPLCLAYDDAMPLWEKLRTVAQHYVQAVNWPGPWRIDVVAVQMDSRGHLQAVEHIRHAVRDE